MVIAFLPLIILLIALTGRPGPVVLDVPKDVWEVYREWRVVGHKVSRDSELETIESGPHGIIDKAVAQVSKTRMNRECLGRLTILNSTNNACLQQV